MEGQLYMGGLASAAAVFALQSVQPIAVPIALAIGAFAGGIFASIASILKIKLGVTEVVSTLLLNYVAYLIVDYVAQGPFHEPGSALNRTPTVPFSSQILSIPGTQIEPTLALGAVLAVAIAYLLARTKFGFELRTMGENPRAARFIGIR